MFFSSILVFAVKDVNNNIVEVMNTNILVLPSAIRSFLVPERPALQRVIIIPMSCWFR
jgi:hypothetical protein